MSRAHFEPPVLGQTFKSLKSEAEIRGLSVRFAKWPHEAAQWGGMFMIRRNGRDWKSAATVIDALHTVRSVEVHA